MSKRVINETFLFTTAWKRTKYLGISLTRQKSVVRNWNIYNIIYEMSCQSRFDAWYWMPGAGALGWPRGMVRGGRKEEGSGWGTCVYLWRIHVDIWQNQYNIVKLKKKRLWQKKLKTPQTDGKIHCFLGLGESILLKWSYRPSQSTDSIQSPSICQWHFSQN